MWRPEESWVKERNIFFETHQPMKPYYKTRQIDYEAGADAMLGTLTKDAPYIMVGDYVEVECNWFTEGTVRIPMRRFQLEHIGPGWLVFIPDES